LKERVRKYSQFYEGRHSHLTLLKKPLVNPKIAPTYPNLDI